MKALVLTCLFAFAAIGSYAQGSLTYIFGVGVGKEPPRLVRTCDGQTVDGSGFTAELWFAMGEGAGDSSLNPVVGSKVPFRTQETKKLDIPGTYGGDIVTLQLRVWNNENGTITSWGEAVEKGKSNLFTHELAGAKRNGGVSLGSGSIAGGLERTILIDCVPEPSVVALGLLGLGSVLMARRRS